MERVIVFDNSEPGYVEGMITAGGVTWYFEQEESATMKWQIVKTKKKIVGTCIFCGNTDIEQVILRQKEWDVELVGYRCVDCGKIKTRLSLLCNGEKNEKEQKE